VRSVLGLLIANIGAHLSDDTLCRLVSGELGSGKLRRAKRHLSKCWKCRSRHEELERAAMGFVELHKQLITPNPPQAAQWRENFVARLDEAAAEVPSFSWSRLLPRLRFTFFANMNPFLASAAVLFVASIVLFLIWQRSAPSVSADELLERAEISDNNSARLGEPGVIYQKITIRALYVSLERDLYRDREGRRRTKSEPAPAEFTPLKAKLNIAGVNWEAPLSASSYKAWHESQREESDEVKRSGKNLLTVTTKVSGGIVVQESLTVREEDFHPVKRTVELVDLGTVEISEVNYAVLGWSAVNDNLFEALTPSVPPNLPFRANATVIPPVVPTPTQLLEAELQARVALHTAGADLGEPVEIIHSPGGPILVQGLASSSQRKQDLLAALKGIPHLEVKLRSVNDALSEEEPREIAPSSREIVVTGHPALEGKLLVHFPNVEERSAFVNRALALFDEGLAHAWALRRLEERYTPDQLSSLSQSDRQTLELLIRDHVASIRQEILDGGQLLGPLVARPTTAVPNPAGASGREDWRHSVRELFDSVQKTQIDVVDLLAGSGELEVDPEALSGDYDERLERTKSLVSLLLDHATGSFLSGTPTTAPPNQNETNSLKTEKP
jgi:hypothetical protein